MTQPMSIGRIVTYKLSDADAHRINSTTGQANASYAGQCFPALVVRTWDGDHVVNLQVFYDGDGSLWATSRTEGDEAGQWSWPTRV